MDRRRGLGLALAVVAWTIVGASAAPSAGAALGNGDIAFTVGGPGSADVWVMAQDGSNLRQITATRRVADVLPVWSPDGTRLLFASNRDGDPDVYTMDPDGTDVFQLTNDPGIDSRADWSPDGTQIAFGSDRAGGLFDVFIMDADDGGNVVNVTNDPANDLQPNWSPDGTTIAFMSRRFGGNRDIYSIKIDGTGLTRLTTTSLNDLHPAWSPDGTRIAFDSNRSGNYEVYVMNADGTGLIQLTDNAASDSEPAWSPDGTKIAFSSKRDGNDDEIYVMNADGTGVIRLTSNDKADQRADWQPVISEPTMPQADLVLTLVDTADPVVVGEAFQYRARVRNRGPDDAAGATLRITLPPEVGYVSSSPTQGSCEQSAGVVSCELGTIPFGVTPRVFFNVTAVSPGEATAWAVASSEASDPSSPNQADQTTTINALP